MMTEALTLRSHRYVSKMMDAITVLKHNVSLPVLSFAG
jgi:hypothetical protein